MKTLLGEDPRATWRLTTGLMLAVVTSVLFVLAVTATPAQALHSLEVRSIRPPSRSTRRPW